MTQEHEGHDEKGLQAQYINIPISHVSKINIKIFLQSICTISINFAHLFHQELSH